jgi:putative membrane protein
MLSNPKAYLLLYAKGLAMGAADVVPGISGGTIAFVTGIYREIIRSISEIDGEAIRLLIKFEGRQFWSKINGNFLIVVIAGVFSSYLTLARFVAFLMVSYPVSVRAFFFGMILISTILVLRQLRHLSMPIVAVFIVAAALAYAFTWVSPIHTPENVVFIFIAGLLAGAAMMLPGISGVFVILIIGQFQYLLSAVQEINLPVIAMFILGGLIGILGFCKFLHALLLKYYNVTIALLSGLMLGSFNKVWPWREVLEYVTDRRGIQVPVFDKSVVPWKYFEITGKDPQVFLTVLIMALA